MLKISIEEHGNLNTKDLAKMNNIYVKKYRYVRLD